MFAVKLLRQLFSRIFRSPRSGSVLLLFLFASLLLNFLFLVFPVHKRPVSSGLTLPTSNSSVSLLDLAAFSYRIDNRVCGESPLFMLMLVTSHQGNWRRRDQWRRVLPRSHLRALQVERLFLLGTASDEPGYTSADESIVRDEAVRHTDILQGSFAESYRHLSYKHAMGLQWAAAHCRRVQYVLKMDDDIGLDLYQLLERLKQHYRPHALLLGLIHFEQRPQRARDSKWFVSDAQVPNGSVYPPFLSGWMYVASLDAVDRLIVAARELTARAPPFWIDDVFMTGMAAERATLRLSSLNSFFTPNWEELECCAQTPRWRCDFIVGPAAERPGLLEAFVAQSRECWRASCRHRRLSSNVTRCVVTPRPEPDLLVSVKGSAHAVPL